MDSSFLLSSRRLRNFTSTATLFALAALLADAAPVQSPAALRKAIAAAKPGAIIELATGTYDSPGSFKITTSGEAQKPITIRAATPGGVTFTGDTQFRIEADFIVISGFRFTSGKPATPAGVFAIKGNANRITECAVIDYNVGSIDDGKTSTFWVGLAGQQNRIDHCYFKGKISLGVLLFVQRPTTAPDHAVIDHNVFRDIPRGANGNGYETIRVGDSKQSQSDSCSAVFENYFENCDGETEVISIKSGKNVIHQNTFINCKGSLTLRHGAGNTATGNFFYVTDPAKTDCCGIRITDRDHVVENNYIAGLRTKNKHLGGLVLMSSESETALPVNAHWRLQNVTLRRNTILDSQQSLVYGGGAYGVAPLSASFEQNLVATPQGDIVKSLTPIVKPAYRGERYHGGALGIAPTPEGIDLKTDPLLVAKILNGYTLFFPAESLHSGAQAEALKPLRESDVGPSYKH